MCRNTSLLDTQPNDEVYSTESVAGLDDVLVRSTGSVFNNK